MAELAIAALGASLGSTAITGTILGMTGSQIGWVGGSLVAGLLFPPKRPDGPRLESRQVQSSTYGKTVSRVWGTKRVAGNVIWATELLEQENEHGKGGSSYSTYSYSCSFAVGMCEGEIDGVSRIWADGKLIYDIRPANQGVQEDFTCTSFTVYPGSETQEVDPTMQAALTNTPAYLGLAYAVFENLQLERYGNRVPNLEFEVVVAGAQARLPYYTFGEYVSTGDTPFQADSANGTHFWLYSRTGHATYADDYVTPILDRGQPGTNQIQRYNIQTGELEFFQDITDYDYRGYGAAFGDGFLVGRGSAGGFGGGIVSCPNPSTAICGIPLPYTHALGAIGNATYSVTDRWSSGQFANFFYWPGTPAMVDAARGVFAVFGENGLAGGLGIRFRGATEYRENEPRCSCAPTLPPFGIAAADVVYAPNWTFTSRQYKNGSIVQGYGGTFSGNTFMMKVTPGSLTSDDYAGYETTSWGFPSSSAVVMPTWVHDPARDVIWTFAGVNGNIVYEDDAATGYEFDVSVGRNVIGATVDSETGYLRLLLGGGLGVTPVFMVLWNPDTEEIVDSFEVEGMLPAGNNGRMWDLPGLSKAVYSNGLYNYVIPYGQTLDSQAIRLSEIVTDLSLEVGLTAGQIDVTELTDLVLGYEINLQASNRSCIEQLMICFAFDAVESEGKVKFVKRGKPPVRTIGIQDLAAHPSGSAAPRVMPMRRSDEQDLPRNVSVRYFNIDNDYQPGLQSSPRLNTLSVLEQAVDVPVVMTDNYAKSLVDSILYSAWTGRLSTAISLTTKHADLEPTDVISVLGKTFRIDKRKMSEGVLEFQCTLDSGQSLVAGGVSGYAYNATQMLTNSSTSELILLDIPLASDDDDYPGFYGGLSGTYDPWSGGEVFVSNDGEDFTSLVQSNVRTIYGVATTALGDYDVNIFDEFNTLTVSLQSGNLASATEAAVLSGANMALVGREIVHFKRAQQQAGGDWLLSGLLRGRKGTPTADHAIGDRFVLLDHRVLRFNDSMSALGVTRQFKAVSSGRSLESAQTVWFANYEKRLKPRPPVHFAGGRMTDGGLVLRCVRRTRVDGEWRNHVDVPVGEDTLLFQFVIYEDAGYSTEVRVLEAAATEVTYTAAQQTADFGTLQSTVYARVFQISASVGRGDYAEGVF